MANISLRDPYFLFVWRVLKQTYLVRAVDELGNMYERETESVQQMCFWETSPALLKLKIYKKENRGE